ncbi:TrmH family RNA methyltransferase [Neoactinobaculum massilliense]|uniref:TrmH family RNA methyltransferase n=1 Tax=Neoactinobaculum massilliense TaxID=2364794 RepID=UPI000F549C8D|nr:RNA methyltransferase [Neoactinobaculum massilliense]
MFKPASKIQLQRAARLSKADVRIKFGQTLVEGPQAVRELLRFGPAAVRDIYLTEEAAQRYPEIADAADAFYAHLVEPQRAHQVAPAAQGVFAVVETPPQPALAEVLEGATFVVATLDIQDPGNLGTIIRAADAAGADAVVIGRGSADCLSPKVIRATAGSIFHLPVVEGVSERELEDELGAAGITSLAADAGGAFDLADLTAHAYRHHSAQGEPDLRAPLAWVLGNEARGFQDSEFAADAWVAIPLAGYAESLKVATAASVLAMTTAMVRRG